MFISKKIFIVILVLCMSFAGVVQAKAAEGFLDPGKYDFGGKTVSILHHEWEPVFEEDNYDLLQKKKQAEKLFNCKIEVIGISDSPEEKFISRVMAGDSRWDIWTCSRNVYYNMLAEGVMFPVSDILPESYYDKMLASKDVYYKIMGHKGKAYGFTDAHAGADLFFFLYNKDMFNNLGLQDPQELYKTGEWTWDNLEQLATALTRDTDGDGKTDVFGLPRYIRWNLLNDAPLVIKKEGKFVYNANSSAFKDSIRYYRKLYTNGVVGWGLDPQEGFLSGKLGMTNRRISGIKGMVEQMEEEGIDLNYGIVPGPKGPNASEYKTPTQHFKANVLPINSANPKGLIALYNYLFGTSPGCQTYDYEEIFKQIAPEKTSYKIVKKYFNNWQGESDALGIYITRATPGGAWPNLMIKPVKKGAEIGTKVEEYAPKIQANLDDLMNQ